MEDVQKSLAGLQTGADVLFLLVGLIILSTEYVWAHRLLTRLKERFPRLGRTADQATVKAAAWLRRISGQPDPD